MNHIFGLKFPSVQAKYTFSVLCYEILLVNNGNSFQILIIKTMVISMYTLKCFLSFYLTRKMGKFLFRRKILQHRDLLGNDLVAMTLH